MNLTSKLLTGAVLLAWASVGHAWDFTVTNATGSAITRILASEDGKTWGEFKLSGPVAPGGSMQLVWAPSTENTGCEWQVKAVYQDGSESDPATFDFCEEDLELEFTE